MSLLRRLWFGVVLAMGAMLLGVCAVGMFTARSYFEQQLQAQAGDAAISLALALSSQRKDEVAVTPLVTSLFDGGHFQSIRFADPHGKMLVERVRPEDVAGVPAWFVSLVPLEARLGQAAVSDGWSRAGLVTVVAARDYVYRSLWRGMLQLGSLALAVGLFWVLAVSALLRRVRRPLDEMAEQAEAIGAGQFRVLAEPSIVELRSMAQAINRMAERVRSLFAEQARRIEALRDESSRDNGTGLLNRDSLCGELRRQLSDGDVPAGGCLGALRIGDLARINQLLGRQGTDEWLAAVGRALEGCFDNATEAALGRLGGAEFAVLLPGCSLSEGRVALERVLRAVTALDWPLQTDGERKISVAVVDYRREEMSPGVVLARLDAALMRAEADGVVVAVSDAASSPSPFEGAEGARTILERALENHDFTLAAYPVLDAEGVLIHQELMLRLCVGEAGEMLTAGQFMPAATRLGLAPACDLEALRLALGRLADSPESIAVNLSPQSLNGTDFLIQLDVLLATAGSAAGRISVEVSERGLGADLSGLDTLAEVLARHGAKLGIEHFGRHLAALPRLYALPLAYLKLDGSFVAGLLANEGQRRLVKAIVDVAQGLGAAVYAEQVLNAEEWRAAADLGIVGMTGPEASRRAGAA